MLYLANNVSRGVIVDLVFRHEVPVGHDMMLVVVSNVHTLLIRELVILHANF